MEQKTTLNTVNLETTTVTSTQEKESQSPQVKLDQQAPWISSSKCP